MRLDRTSEIIRVGVELVTSRVFLAGLGIGVTCAGLGLWMRDNQGKGRGWAAGLAATASGAFLAVLGSAPRRLPLALALLTVAGATGFVSRSSSNRALVSLAGGALIASGSAGDAGFRIAVFAGVAILSFLVSEAEDHLPPPVATTRLLALSTVAVVVGIPDVERSLVMAGAAIALAVIPAPSRRLGPGGALAFPALLAWTVVVDGAGGEGAVLGSLAALGILALGRYAPRIVEGLSGGGILLVQGAWALFASRLAGVRRDTVTASVILLAGAALAWAALEWRRRAETTRPEVTPSRRTG